MDRPADHALMGEVAVAFLEQVPDAVVGVDTGGTVRLVNGRAEELFGWPRAEVLGQSIDRLLPERFRERHRGQAHGFSKLPHHRPMGTDLSLFGLRKDGTEFPADIALAPIMTTGGLLVVSFVRDLTARRKLEADLAEAIHRAALAKVEERFEKAFVASPAGMCICTTDDRTTVDVNGAFTASLGFTRQEAVGRSLAELGVWQAGAEREAFWQGVRPTGSMHARQVKWRSKGGQPRDLVVSVETIEYDSKALYLVLFLDLTEELAADRLREELIDLVSHELRTPATIIQGYGEILGSGHAPAGSKEAAAAAANIQRASKHLSYLLGEVLELVRLRARSAALDRVPFDAEDLVAEAIEVIRARRPAGAPPVQVRTKGGRTPVWGDWRKLLMAAVELIDNADRHSGRRRDLEVDIARGSAGWVLTVADRGPGFPDHVLKNLGRPFTTGQAGGGGLRRGAGLGLALAAQIARAHEGRLEVEPRPGGGSTVRLVLPLAPVGEGL